MTLNLKKYFNLNKFVLSWVIVATIFGAFTALSNSQFLNTGRDVFAAKNCPNGRSVVKDGKEICEVAFCEEGDVTKADNYICTAANKEESIEMLCNDNQKPKAGPECNFTQTGLASVYGGGACPAGTTEIYSNGGFRQGKLCSYRPDFFSRQSGCQSFNKLFINSQAQRGQVIENGDIAEAILNNTNSVNDSKSCIDSCSEGYTNVVYRPDIYKLREESTSIRNVCTKIISGCNDLICSFVEPCNDNLEGFCKIYSRQGGLFGTELKDGAILYFKSDSCGGNDKFFGYCNTGVNLVDQRNKKVKAPCQTGTKPFFSYTGTDHLGSIGGVLCVKNEYNTPVKYVAGGAIASTVPRQCNTTGQIEVYFEDKNNGDGEMDLLCTPRTFPPQFEKKTYVCPAGWTSYSTEKCQKPAEFKTLDESSLDVTFNNSCDKTTLKSGESTVCTSQFSYFLSGKIVFSNDKNDERCEIVVPDGNSGSGTCILTLTNKSPIGKYYTVEEFQIKARFDIIELTKPAGKINVYPQECTTGETEIGQVCQAALAIQAKYEAPVIEYDGSFPSGPNPLFTQSSTSTLINGDTTSTGNNTGSDTLIDTNKDGVIDNRDIQPERDTNGDGKIDFNDLIDSNKDNVIDNRDIQPTIDTNGDGKIDFNDLIDSNKDNVIDNRDMQPTIDTNGDGKIDFNDLIDSNKDGVIDNRDIQPERDSNGDGKIDFNDLIDSNKDGVIDNRDIQPERDSNGDGKIDFNDLIDSNKDGVIDNRDIQPTIDTNESAKIDYLNGLNFSSDPNTIASDKEISDAIKCTKDEKDKTIVTCEGQLPQGKTANDLKIKIGEEEISCNVSSTGKITCDTTKIKELETNPDQNLSFFVKTADNPKFIETKLINFAKSTTISCEDNFELCFDNEATQEELAQAIKCRKDDVDPTIVICEGQLLPGKTAEDIKIKIGDNSIASCSIDESGKIKCKPMKIKELEDNPNQDLSFSVLNKFYSKLKEVKKINFFTGKESFCSVKDVKCINQGATKVSLAQNSFVDPTCSGITNKCLSGTGDFGNAKGYQNNGIGSIITNNTFIITLIMLVLLAAGVGVYAYFKYFKKDKLDI